MLIAIPFLASFIALAFVFFLVSDVLKAPRGNATMVEISDAIQTGAKAFLKREYSYIAVFIASRVVY